MKTVKHPIKPTIQLDLEAWKTMEQDISYAHDLIVRHHDDEGPLSVYLQEAVISLEGSVAIKQADWVIELQEHYEGQYGEEKGDEIMRRVISALLTHGTTIH